MFHHALHPFSSSFGPCLLLPQGLCTCSSMCLVCFSSRSWPGCLPLSIHISLCCLLRQVFAGLFRKMPLLLCATSPYASFRCLFPWFSCLLLLYLYYNSSSVGAGTVFDSSLGFFNLTVSVSPVAESQVNVTSHAFSLHCFSQQTHFFFHTSYPGDSPWI